MNKYELLQILKEILRLWIPRLQIGRKHCIEHVHGSCKRKKPKWCQGQCWRPEKRWQSLSETREARVRADSQGQKYLEAPLALKPVRCRFKIQSLSMSNCVTLKKKIALISEPLFLHYKNGNNDTYAKWAVLKNRWGNLCGNKDT